MKKTRLKQQLSRLEGFSEPRVELEQYLTPPQLAADLVHAAYMQGDIENREVADLGTGTGMLAIGAALAGGNVTAVEKDREALEAAKRNAREAGADIEFVEADIGEIEGEFDTVVMNPPFSVHSDEGDRFFRKAFSLAGKVYSIAPGGARERIKDLAGNSSHRIVSVEHYTIALPPSYGFHTQDSRETEVDIIVTEDTENGA